MSLNTSDFSLFFMKKPQPPPPLPSKKNHSLCPSNHPLKIEILSSPTFAKIWSEAQPPYCLQSSQLILKSLSEKHDQNSIILTNVFDHGLTTLLSIFLVLRYLFIPLYASVYTLKICKWFKNKNTICILAQYKWNPAIKIHRKESQPRLFRFCFIFKFSFSHNVWNNIYKSWDCWDICFYVHSPDMRLQKDKFLWQPFKKPC